MEISLWFERKNRFLSSEVQDTLSKAFCHVSFLTEDERWSRTWPAIIDTGAHTTVIPEFIWRDLSYEPLSESLFLGVKSNLLCSIPCKVAKIYAKILDQQNQTKPLLMHAYLAKSNDVPLLLGISTALENFTLNLNYKKQTGYLKIDE
ncbi:MAG: hypothetical protein CVV50_00530 [Spirochaetae bacterium HGW-Spirochaetae-6]|jgi:hypothetical protein|nr:MAG: hypothetical protein CVV50_00530 [Spirochaetae bacterium HGW-Spirochaetae-6]